MLVQAPEQHVKAALLTEAHVAAGAAEVYDSKEEMHKALSAAMEVEGEPQEVAQERSEPVAAAV